MKCRSITGGIYSFRVAGFFVFEKSLSPSTSLSCPFFPGFFLSCQAVAEVKVGKDTPVLDAAGKAGFFLWRSTYVVKQASGAPRLQDLSTCARGALNRIILDKYLPFLMLSFVFQQLWCTGQSAFVRFVSTRRVHQILSGLPICFLSQSWLCCFNGWLKAKLLQLRLLAGA